MFRQAWKKYLPVIAILLKRSVNEEQTLDMNHTDFERAAGGRKVKFGFSPILLNKGRTDYSAKLSPLAKDLVMILQEEVLSQKLIQNMILEISMNNSFQLIIKNLTPPAESDIEKNEKTGTPEMPLEADAS